MAEVETIVASQLTNWQQLFEDVLFEKLSQKLMEFLSGELKKLEM